MTATEETPVQEASAPGPSLPARFFKAIPQAMWYLFAAYIVVCLVLNVCVAPFVSYRTNTVLSPYGVLFLVGGILLGAACCLLAKKASMPPWLQELRARNPFLAKHGFGVFVAVGTVILLCVQAFIIKGALFVADSSDWTTLMAFDDPLELSAYLSVCPNNQFLCGIFVMLFRLADAVGWDAYILCVSVGCLSISASICLSAFVARKLGGTSCGLCAFLLLFVFVGLNPTLLIPYTDAYGMIYPVLTLFFFVCIPNRIKWPLMLFVTLLGYEMKATTIAMFASILIVQACFGLAHWLDRHKEPNSEPPSNSEHDTETAPSRLSRIVRGPILVLLLCAVALGAGIGCANFVKAQPQVRTYPEEALVPAHFLMIGFNTKYDGMFNSADLADHSFNYHTKKSMTEGDLAEWRRRVQELGAPGVLNLMMRKNLINYDRGDFNFDRSATYSIGTIRGDDPTLQAFYGITDPVDHEDHSSREVESAPPWSCLAQLLWYMTLVGIALSFWRRKPSCPECAVALQLLLVSGFLLLFECSARYLFLYSPFFVILAVRGWQAFGQWFCAWRGHRVEPPDSKEAQ